MKLVAIAVVTMLVACVSAPQVHGASTSVSNGSFCRESLVAHNYLKPLRRFPQHAAVSFTARLGFGPDAFRMVLPWTQLVVINHGAFRVSGRIVRNPKRESPLDWRVTSTLEVHRSREDFRAIRSGRQYIHRFAGFNRRKFGFGAAVRPGIYRLAIKFENASGKLLGHFVEFFRAVRAKSRLELAVDPPVAHAGETGRLRVENFGTMRSSYSYRYRLWSIGPDGLTEIPYDPPGVMADLLPFIGAGAADGCFLFQTPSSLPAGEYLIGVHVNNALLRRRSAMAFGRFKITS